MSGSTSDKAILQKKINLTSPANSKPDPAEPYICRSKLITSWCRGGHLPRPLSQHDGRRGPAQASAPCGAKRPHRTLWAPCITSLLLSHPITSSYQPAPRSPTFLSALLPSSTGACYLQENHPKHHPNWSQVTQTFLFARLQSSGPK